MRLRIGALLAADLLRLGSCAPGAGKSRGVHPAGTAGIAGVDAGVSRYAARHAGRSDDCPAVVRIPQVRVDSAALAIIADYSPSVVGNAASRTTNLSSLDNTIRFADSAPEDTDWVLCDNRVEFMGNGFAHTSCLMWSESGRLLATASQSMTILPV